MSYPTVRPNILAIKPYTPGKPIEEVQRELGLSYVVKLASNENPLGPSPKALEAMRRAASETHRYPDAGSVELRDALGARYSLPTEQIAVGNGSDELLTLSGAVLINPGDHIVLGHPSFLSYWLVAGRTGAEATAVPLTADARHDLPAMAAACGPRTKLLLIANPNNPTGTIVSHQEVVALLDSIPPHVLVILDEAYYEYVDEASYPNSLALLKEGRENLAITRTFSKIYGLAGVRAGYMLGPSWLVDAIQRAREPFNLNLLAQAGALAALEDHEHVRRSRDVVAEGMARAEKLFESLRLPWVKSHGNFIWVDARRPATDVFDRLLHLGVIVRPGHIFGYPTHLRVTIGTPEEMDKFEQAFVEVLGQ